MKGVGTWVSDDNLGLFTDLYELTMAQAYWREGMNDSAVFTLFCRRLPAHWNYLIACGLDDALHCLEAFHFNNDALAYLDSTFRFSRDFLDVLRTLRFSGDVFAVPEGTPVFANEPILEVVAPLIEAQLLETILMNQIHAQTAFASKASRVVAAAAGRQVVDFGLRRIHGADAGLKSARAFHIAGVASTSNVLAGQVYGVPIAGTMAHSYIQAHDSEAGALRSFLELYPDSILLVDTYDTLRGVETVIELARSLGDEFRATGIRLDSGDLASLAIESRRLLDAAGLQRVSIFASGGLDEYQIADLISSGAPIDGFGVGGAMGNVPDAPALDFAYKLSEYAGLPRIKTSPNKLTLPGQKQIVRHEQNRRATGDIITRWSEKQAEPPNDRTLMRRVMHAGQRTREAHDSLDAARARAHDELERLPSGLSALDKASAPYDVRVSPELERLQSEAIATASRNTVD